MRRFRCDLGGGWIGCSYLLHDAGLALREGDVTTRLVLDEFDVNLPPFATGLVVVVVVVVASGRTDPSPFHTAVLCTAVAVAGAEGIVASRGGVLIIRIGNVRHDLWLGLKLSRLLSVIPKRYDVDVDVPTA